MPIPLLAGVLSAIGPMLAKKGLSMLTGVFQGTVDKGTEEIAELIKSKTGIDVIDVADDKLTEDQWMKLREFEHEYQEHLLSYKQSVAAKEVEMAEIQRKDRERASSMQEQAMKSEGWLVRNFVYLYALLITVLTFVFIFMVIFNPPAKGSDATRIVDTVLGFLLGVSLSAIIQFFFGSSQGSAKKQDQIDRLSQQAITANPVQQTNRGG